MNRKGIGGHTMANNGRHELWLTPPQLLHPLGEFDLDPCACPEPRPFPTARHHIALPQNGLTADWVGRVWLNPPYGDKIGPWMEHMAQHGSGIALTFARTETDFWQTWIWPFAKALLFLKGRLNFYLPDGSRSAYNAGGPSVLIAYSNSDATILQRSGIAGAIVEPFQLNTRRAATRNGDDRVGTQNPVLAEHVSPTEKGAA
ncbi:MAG TPA: DNA N-6-adenine-methyltransferase [Candidatus Angelobacter sp.]|nr:DNA N-6-adenine-methyltransferase [Candidatus Angelobacter sp.]